MKNNTDSGFTRVDLLALVVVFGLGGLVTLPALATIARDANAEICQSNQRQLMRALHLYCADNDGYFPYNRDNVNQWITQSGSSLTDSTNRAKLFDPNYSMLARYLDPRVNVFRCPADSSAVTNGTALVPKVRSVSMNGAVGTRNDFPGRYPVDGPWLDGNHLHTANSKWRCYGRLADVVNPSPSSLFVLLDEDRYSINDGSYAGMGPGLQSYRWIDWPATFHDNGAGFAFADGHSETHKWVSLPGTMTPVYAPGTNDLLWVVAHTSALISEQP